uniref:Uncharacterized protein n=1 Tax=Arundo donax TaxID=35708 RepID=A0A0A8XQ71_ARUDO
MISSFTFFPSASLMCC